MATRGQLFYFLLCVGLGFASGCVWQILSLLSLPFPKGKVRKGANILLDCLFFVFFGACCCQVSAHFALPDHRAYRYIGYAIGLIIYLKSVKNILDFIFNNEIFY